jgi:quinol monooxygenase YgiN
MPKPTEYCMLRCAVLLQAFVLMVTLSFQDELYKQDFLSFWQPLADHVRAHEPGTLAFEVLQSDSSPTEVLVYERCVSIEERVGW